jgi:DNA-binding response OmpR family regulator
MVQPGVRVRWFQYLSDPVDMTQAELWTRRALIVEDDDVVARLLQVIFQSEGYAVARVADGAGARALIAAELPPDVVTLDGLLPDATGRELLDTMRATPEWKQVPVLVLSAEPQDYIDATAEETDILAYMEKPFRAEELRACISRLLKGRSFQRVNGRAAARLARHGRSSA